MQNSLTNGCAVKLTGVLADSIGRGQSKELQVQEVEVVGECDPEVSTDCFTTDEGINMTFVDVSYRQT